MRKEDLESMSTKEKLEFLNDWSEKVNNLLSGISTIGGAPSTTSNTADNDYRMYNPPEQAIPESNQLHVSSFLPYGDLYGDKKQLMSNILLAVIQRYGADATPRQIMGLAKEFYDFVENTDNYISWRLMPQDEDEDLKAEPDVPISSRNLNDLKFVLWDVLSFTDTHFSKRDIDDWEKTAKFYVKKIIVILEDLRSIYEEVVDFTER